jgi:hypothetical protein
MVLNHSQKTVPSRVARCLRLVADHIEGEYGYHVLCYPLPADLGQLKAYAKGGTDLKKVNKARTDAGLYPIINESGNIKLADAKWGGLVDGTGCIFRIVHAMSIHHMEFASDELIKTIVAVANANGCHIEVLHNTNHSVIYLYELSELS